MLYNIWYMGVAQMLLKLQLKIIKKEARELYEAVDNVIYSYKEVARHIGVSESLIKKFAAEDRKIGNPWKKVKKRELHPINKERIKEVADKQHLSKNEILHELFNDISLSDQEKIFCLEYLKSFSIKGSTKTAGYADPTLGYIIFKRNRIKKTLARLSDIMSTRLYLRAERVIQRHTEIAFLDIKDFVKWGTKETTTTKYNREEDSFDQIPQKIDFVELKDMDDIDGTLVKTVRKGRWGVEIELEDRSKSLHALTQLLLLTQVQKSQQEIAEKRFDLDALENPGVGKVAEIIRGFSDAEVGELMNELKNK